MPEPISPIHAVLLRLLLENTARLFGSLPDDPFNQADWTVDKSTAVD